MSGTDNSCSVALPLEVATLARAHALLRAARQLAWDAGEKLRDLPYHTLGNPLHDETRRINYEVCGAASALLKLAEDVDRLLPQKPPRNSCNRHSDCSKAKTECCHDEGCEECFGS